jgi:hypothetical protein
MLSRYVGTAGCCAQPCGFEMFRLACQMAVTTGQNAMKQGDVGSCVLVCISDGRANVPISKSFQLDLDLTDEGEKPIKPDKEAREAIKVSEGQTLCNPRCSRQHGPFA